jgi:hypothetical protein
VIAVDRGTLSKDKTVGAVLQFDDQFRRTGRRRDESERREKREEKERR